MTDREKIIYDILCSDEQPPEGQHWEGFVTNKIVAALAQPEQEPVAFYVYKPTLPRGNLGNVADGDLPWIYDQDPSSGYSARMLVYTAPPQREWQGLTDEETNEIAREWQETPDGLGDLCRAIEAKLKEKNGY